MSETIKSAIYVGVALVCALGAFFISRPSNEETTSKDLVGTLLAPKFEDPNQAASMRVVTYNEELAELSKFEVAKNSAGQWIIPSESDYPADAEEQMVEAGNHLIGEKIFDVAGDDRMQHAEFGVLDPDEVEIGKTGFGAHVTIKDEKGEVLADVIIGKKVKDEPNKRFVRKVGQDPTYVCEVDPTKFSTKFEDWIDSDLLELKSIDVAKMRFRDYSLEPADGGLRPNPRVDVSVAWDDAGNPPKWMLDAMIDYRNGNPVDTYLLADETLDATKLDGVKSSLNDINISGVLQKPKGLGADLRVNDDFLADSANRNSLRTRGFYPVRMATGQHEILSTNGEIHITLRDGVRYIMRWGGVVAQTSGDISRFLFVTTEFAPEMLPEPKYEPLPTVNEATGPKAAADESDTKKGDTTKKAGEQQAPQESPEDARKRIEKANDLKKKEWEEQVAEAKKRSEYLNQKFANWFYLVSSDIYSKLYLSRYEMIKTNSADTGPDVFRKMQAEGVEKKAPPSPHGGPGGPGGPGGGLNLGPGGGLNIPR